MNKLGKILVVFVAIASLCFMAFTAAVTLGGPNWFGMANQMTDFTYEEGAGKPTTYTMKLREGDFSTQSQNLPEVVVKSLQKQAQDQTAREQELDQNIANMTAIIENTKKFKQTDIAALKAREQEIMTYIANLNQQIVAINDRIKTLTAQTIALDQELTLRREDVLRLRDQLELLRTDQQRLIDQKGELQDVLALLQGSIGQLQRRTEQLQKQQGTVPQSN